MRILIVDDSVVFRSQIKGALEGVQGLEVVGVAANGKIALDRLEQMPVDLIVLDLEMPEMNGMQTLAEMRKRNLRQKVIVFAAPSQVGALQALDALQAGASDFVAKPQGTFSLEESLEKMRQDLVPKIAQFALRGAESPRRTETPERPAPHLVPAGVPAWKPVLMETFKPKAVLIGSSTGGPTALEKIFSSLNGHLLRVPIFIAQHMPPVFTDSLARRLGQLCGSVVTEGRDGEPVQNGRVYVAPGDFHMTLSRAPAGGQVIIRLDQSPKRNSVRPAVDNLFESAAKVYGGACAGIILTGMGADGMIGCKAIKDATGGVMIQDRDSSIVWGMPGAVHEVGAYDSMGDLEACGKALIKMAT